MTLTPIVRANQREKIFFMNSTYIMSKSGIQRFWAQEAEMTLTPISSHGSARKKFFMNCTYIMSRK